MDRVTLSATAEVVALVGPSGSDKTTLLRVSLGLETPSDGEVRIGGQVVSESALVLVLPEERNVAMVFQDLALWPHLSVHGNLAFGLRVRGVERSERERQITEVLSWCVSMGRRPATLTSFPAVSDSAWRSRERWCSTPSHSYSTSLSPTST